MMKNDNLFMFLALKIELTEIMMVLIADLYKFYYLHIC